MFMIVVMLLMGQMSQSDIYEIQSQKFLTNLHSSIDILHDNSGGIGIHEVLSDEINNRFRPLHQKSMQFGYIEGAYWLRFTLKNPLPSNNTLYLIFKNPSLESIQFYFRNPQGQQKRIQTGSSFSFSSRPVSNNKFIIPIIPEPHSISTYYIRVSSKHVMDLNMRLMDSSTFLHYQQSDTFFFAFLLSILFMLVSYAFMSFVIYNQRAFFHLAFISFWTLVYFITKHGQLSQFFPHVPNWEIQIRLISVCFILLHLLLHHSHHLMEEDSQRKSYLISLGQKVLPFTILIIAAIAIFDSKLASQANNWLAASILCLLLIMSCIAHRRKIPFSYLFVMANGFIIVPYTLQLLDKFTAFNFEWLAYNGFHVCVILYLCIITIAISWKEKHIREIHQQKALQNNIELKTIKVKQELVSRLNHSIRTPINGIMGMTELLRDTCLSATQREYLSTLHTSSLNLLQLITDEMSMINFQKKNFKLQQIPFELSQMMIDGLNQIKHVAERQGTELICSLSPELPSFVQGDPNRIQQVIRFLLADMMDQNQYSEILIEVIEIPVDSSDLNKPHRSPNNAKSHIIEIQLSGSSPRHIQNLKLNQNSALNSQELSQSVKVSNELISLMGGTLFIQNTISSPQVRFTLELFEDKSLQALEDNATLPLNGLNALVVDDSETCCQVIQQQLLSWNMKVTYCQSGIEAIALINTQANINDPFDLIILDYKMPSMNGLELAVKINEDALITNDLLIIMLTGSMDAPHDEAIRNAGIKCVLTKPVSGKALKITLSQELSYLSRFHDQAHKRDHSLTLSSYKRLKVLVADPDPSSSKILIGMLSVLGVTAETVNNGLEAINTLQSNRYNLVLLECHLPMMSGLEVTKKFRDWEKQNNFPPTPIIAVSSQNCDELLNESSSVGMNTYLQKPIALSQLQEILEMHSSRLVEENLQY